MKRLRFLSVITVIVLALSLLPFYAAQAEPIEICEKWGTAELMGGEYILQNNIWGADTAQCISADTNSTSFTVTQSNHSQGSVASYPSIFKGCHWGDCSANSGMPVPVNSVSTAPFSWSVSGTNASGTWNAAAEAWFSPIADSTDGYDGGAELMIWLDYQGMQPAGSQVGTVSIGGATWEVWYAQLDWNYIAYRRTSATTSINADLMDFIDDSVSRGWIESSWYLHDMEAGFELMTAGAGLTTDSFSFSVDGDSTPVPTEPVPTDEPTATPPPTGDPICEVDYTISNDWGSGATISVDIINNDTSAINGWTLEWTFSGDQQITNLWGGSYTQSGADVDVTNGSWNATIGANGGSVNVGFNIVYSGSNEAPTDFTLNGVACNSGGGPDPTEVPTQEPTPSPTPVPTAGPTPTPTPVPTQGPTPTPPPPGTHVDNPFVGAQGYINPDYVAQVEDQAAATGGSLGGQMLNVADYSTAVWMDRIGAITEGRGLQGHLDEALAQQQASGVPVTIMVVIYDLPNRDCAALASNGELLVAENGIERYETEYIDPIVDIMSDPAYSDLRIVTIIEPDSLPNLITNLDEPLCAEADSSNAYEGGIQYAVNQLHTLSNVYIYLDIAHSGWLGWSSNFDPAVQLYTQVVQGTDDGFNSIDGFITNVANYTPAEEVFLPNPDLTVGGQQVKSADFYEWNPYFDELDFATDLRTAFINAGFPGDIGMLIDTSRNGWGGSERPTEVSTATQVNPYVDESRLDRRPHRGGWCNQAGAGIGERPQVEPAPGLDAFVWVKPPGESDGVSEPGIEDPNDPNKSFDAMCDPNAQSTYDSSYGTNALPNAPHAGRWFAEQFEMLVENAYPPLQ